MENETKAAAMPALTIVYDGGHIQTITPKRAQDKANFTEILKSYSKYLENRDSNKSYSNIYENYHYSISLDFKKISSILIESSQS